jgi:hypothetical protein
MGMIEERIVYQLMVQIRFTFGSQVRAFGGSGNGNNAGDGSSGSYGE